MSRRHRPGLVRASGDALRVPLQAHAAVLPEHADLRIVLHPLEIRVVLNPEREVPPRVETVARKAIVPDREGFRQERLRGAAAQRDAGPDRHVPTDAPIPDRLMTEGLPRLLFRDQPEDLLRLHEFLSRLADADVDHDLLDPDVAHARHGPPYSADTSGVLIDGASLPTTKTLPASVEKPSVNVTMFARGFRVRWTSSTCAISPTCWPPVTSTGAPLPSSECSTTFWSVTWTFSVAPVLYVSLSMMTFRTSLRFNCVFA